MATNFLGVPDLTDQDISEIPGGVTMDFTTLGTAKISVRVLVKCSALSKVISHFNSIKDYTITNEGNISQYPTSFEHIPKDYIDIGTKVFHCKNIHVESPPEEKRPPDCNCTPSGGTDCNTIGYEYHPSVFFVTLLFVADANDALPVRLSTSTSSEFVYTGTGGFIWHNTQAMVAPNIRPGFVIKTKRYSITLNNYPIKEDNDQREIFTDDLYISGEPLKNIEGTVNKETITIGTSHIGAGSGYIEGADVTYNKYTTIRDGKTSFYYSISGVLNILVKPYDLNQWFNAFTNTYSFIKIIGSKRSDDSWPSHVPEGAFTPYRYYSWTSIPVFKTILNAATSIDAKDHQN